MQTINVDNIPEKGIPSAVLAVIMVVIVEAMFFGGLISAFIIARAGQVEWPPADQPRLPFVITFGNMLVLLFSAFLLYLFIQKIKKARQSSNLLDYTIALGFVFFIVQGFEWIRILIFGIQAPPSLFASFFYTLIGLHGLHVLTGLFILIYARQKILKAGSGEAYSYALASGIFWFFVVGLWPVLYYLIYL